MKKDTTVWVEGTIFFDGEPQCVRIFKSRRAAHAAFTSRAVFLMPYAAAVYSIRHQIFMRSHGFCEICATPITESGGHLHEQVHRGKGGEISLANSVFICPTCHAAAHKDRNPRFSKKPLDT